MSFIERLKAMIAVKELSPKLVHEKTGIPYDQLDRIGTGPRGPSAAKLKDIVLGLQLDANYLLETDDSYLDMAPIQAAANMSLDRFLVGRSRQRKPIADPDVTELRYVADHSPRAPLWVAEWEAHHERMTVSAKVRPELPRAEPQHVRRRQGRLRT